ncbi:hypothetical protein, partial [Pseudoflavonifractor sp. MCC625]|uniref:hypothetical protein n=1 Tax=Pseudoflavonifractor sp. MCC625 TaxID=2592647 RepID=UPI001C022676
RVAALNGLNGHGHIVLGVNDHCIAHGGYLLSVMSGSDLNQWGYTNGCLFGNTFRAPEERRDRLLFLNKNNVLITEYYM